MPKPRLEVGESPPASRAAPGLQCLERVGRRGLAGSRLCAWPRHSPAVPTATFTSGCSQAALAGRGASAWSRGATSSAGHAASSEASWLFAARRVCQASLHASDMSMNTKYLVTPLGGHYLPLGNGSVGPGWGAGQDSAPKSSVFGEHLLPMAKAGTGLPPAQGWACKGRLHQHFSCSPLKYH